MTGSDPTPTGDHPTTVLTDGSIVEIVAMGPDDAERLVLFHSMLSAETTRLRFFSVHPELSEQEVERFTHVDHVDREAFVAMHAGTIIGVARFDRLSPGGDVAEVAFVVADPWQGRGLGTILFDHLCVVTRRRGIRRLTAEVLAYNRRMLTVFRRAGLTVTERSDGDVIHVSMTFPD